MNKLSYISDFFRGDRALATQWRRRKVSVLLWGAAVVLLCAVVYFVGVANRVPLGDLTRDPAAIAFTPFYNGFISMLGIMCWSATAAIWLVGALLVRRNGATGKYFGFFLAGMVLTVLLMLDDAYMFHENLFPNILHLDEKVLYGIYAAYMIYYFWNFTARILESDYLPLVIALGCFATSLIIDQVAPGEQFDMFFEDVFKFVGIVFWMVYPLLTVPRLVKRG